MFAFYFGIVADVTPPVALAAFAGSGIARSNAMRTGVNAFKLSIAAFLIPYIFVYSPQLLMIDTTFFEALFVTLTALTGMIGVGAAVSGYLLTHTNILERILLFGGGLMMISPGITTDLLGFGLLALVILYQFIRSQRGQKHKDKIPKTIGQ